MPSETGLYGIEAGLGFTGFGDGAGGELGVFAVGGGFAG
jgi:hypothetical protein